MGEGLIEPDLSDICTQLNRPDIGPAELVLYIEETLAHLGLAMTAEDLLARPAGDGQRQRVLSCLALPQPRLAMAMPEHNLGPAKSSRNSRRSWTKRLTFALAPSRKN